MDNNQSFWSWLVAILLALILAWMLMTGRGPSNACCGATASTEAAPVDAAPIAAPVADFTFNASCQEITHLGDVSGISWLSNTDDLDSTLCSSLGGASDIAAHGDAQNITLTGSVDDEATKMQIESEAQAFFGNETSIDNQITVNTLDAPADTPVAKLYFGVGKTSLPPDYDSALAPIIESLNNNPGSKAVFSGYHDPTGDKAFNQELAKNRAKAVYEVLREAGIDESRLEMRKPVQTEGDGSLKEARRVEVSVE